VDVLAENGKLCVFVCSVRSGVEDEVMRILGTVSSCSYILYLLYFRGVMVRTDDIIQ